MGQVDTISLWHQWREQHALCKQAIKDASSICVELARAESAYYAAKAQAALEMKAKNEPVTLIQMVVKGVPEVADKLFDFRLAESKYKSAMEAVKTYRDSERYAYEEYKRSMMGG